MSICCNCIHEHWQCGFVLKILLKGISTSLKRLFSKQSRLTSSLYFGLIIFSMYGNFPWTLAVFVYELLALNDQCLLPVK